MAHYASDCWDCELLTSYGWIESVGLADRSAFDLECHSKGIGKTIVAARPLKEPRKEETIKIILNKGPLGKKFKKEAKVIFDHMDQLDNNGLKEFKAKIDAGEEYEIVEGDKTFKLDKSDVSSTTYIANPLRIPG